MTDLYDHLFPAYRDTASMPDDERIDWLRRDRWMALPQAGEALRRLEDVLTYPQRGRMPCLLLFGTTGMGKSEIVNRFAELHASSATTSAPGSRQCRWWSFRCLRSQARRSSTPSCCWR